MEAESSPVGGRNSASHVEQQHTRTSPRLRPTLEVRSSGDEPEQIFGDDSARRSPGQRPSRPVQMDLFGRPAALKRRPPASVREYNFPQSSVAGRTKERTKKQQPPVGVCSPNNAACKQPETSISLKSRLTSYPHQLLEVCNGQLFCKACMKVMCNVKAKLERHIASANHAESVLKLEQKKADDMLLTDIIDAYYKSHSDESMASAFTTSARMLFFCLIHCICLTASALATDVHVHRTKVVKMFMMSGTPLERIQLSCDLLVGACGKATDRCVAPQNLRSAHREA
eukprot:159379-Pleurochrysis_carterae.AAC.2